MSEPTTHFRESAPVVPPLLRSTTAAYAAAMIGALWYALFILDITNRGQTIPWLILLLAESVLLANVTGMIWTILSTSADRQGPEAVQQRREELAAGRRRPDVDVLITVYGEPLDVIETTVRAARDMKLEHRTLVCDDGRSPQVEELCERLGVDYLTRDGNEGAKAGNLNHALAHCNGEFFVTLDADHVVHPDFLLVTLPWFVDSNLGFVQSPQNYHNVDQGWVARGAAEAQRVFYELVCPGKNAFNAMFYVGTNAIFRRDAIDEIGGVDQASNSEDIWTSLRLHQAGWTSRFVPEVLAKGLSPRTVAEHINQQFRWARGGCEILFHAGLWRDRSTTRDQKLQYSLVGIHFLQALSVLWFVSLPALFILFELQPLNNGGETWLLRYLPFYLFTQMALYFQLGTWHPSALALSIATAPTHVRALFSTLTKRDARWKVTNSTSGPPRAVDLMPGAVGLAALNAAALVVGLASFERRLDVAISLLLCSLHVVVLGTVLLRAAADRRQASTTDNVPESEPGRSPIPT